MNNLQVLIGYEYKKIFMRKSTWIILAIAVLFTLFSCFEALIGTVSVEGKPVYSHYEQMTTNRAYARALNGRKVDADLIGEMQRAYAKVPDIPLCGASEEYETYARPYSEIHNLVSSITKDYQNVNGKNYYSLRTKVLQNNLKIMNLSKVEIKKHLEQNNKIKTPFIFRYTFGYEHIMMLINFLGIVITFVIAIGLAPIFANEHTDRTDQLILTTRLGKNKAILAKLITGISFGFIVSVILLLLLIIPTLIIYGFDGWNAPIQLILISSTNPLMVWQGVLILCGMAILSSILIVSLSLFLSAKLKSAFGTIVFINIFTITCIFINVPSQYRILYHLFALLPAKLTSISTIYFDYIFELFGRGFIRYQTVPVIYFIASAILLLFGYRCFKHHQIS